LQELTLMLLKTKCIQHEPSNFIKNILICVPKMNEGITGLDMKVSN